jgi:hypothetical protein
MRRWLFVALAASTTLAVPSGRRWSRALCNPSPCQATEVCTGGRCAPAYRVATGIGNYSPATPVTTAPGVSVAYIELVDAVRRSFDTWAQTSVCTTSWASVRRADFAMPVGRGAIAAMDGHNSVIWTQGTDWPHGPSTLAVTPITTIDASSTIIDADMEMNNNLPLAANANAVSFDFESVILHEVGHFLGLSHSAAGSIDVMAPELGPGVVRRTLSTADQQDVCTVYSGTSGGQGEACAIDMMGRDNCSQGRVCEGPPSTRPTLLCTQDCSSPGQACPTGFTCQASTNGFACLPVVGAPDLCRFCTSGSSCSSGLCLRATDGANRGQLWCTIPCTTDSRCGPGYTCQSNVAGRFCAPTNPQGCPGQCTLDTDCAPGFRCSMGTCVPTLQLDQRCELHRTCASCQTCVTDDDGGVTASCRACCAGTGALGQCQGCPTMTCPGVKRCTPLVGNESACIPTDGGAICGFCGPNRPCRTGVCVDSVCRTECNPAAPGTCPACRATSRTTGVCACPFEYAREGDDCGLVMTADAGEIIRTCLGSMVCHTPQAGRGSCRERCEGNGELDSCREGYRCLTVGQDRICVPGDPGTQACVGCFQGACQATLKCVNGRCYLPCSQYDPSTCSSCVPTDVDGTGVCACTSERTKATNESCGISGSPVACRAGSVCFNNTCRTSCDPAEPTACRVGEECRVYASGSYCIDQGFGAGGSSGAGGAGGMRPRTGGAGGMSGPPGCGCSSGHALWLLAAMWTVGARKRRPVFE